MSHLFKSFVQSYVYLLCLDPARNDSHSVKHAVVLTVAREIGQAVALSCHERSKIDLLKSSACRLHAHTTIHTNMWHELRECLRARRFRDSLLLHTTCVRSCCNWRASCVAAKHQKTQRGKNTKLPRSRPFSPYHLSHFHCLKSARPMHVEGRLPPSSFALFQAPRQVTRPLSSHV